MGRHSTHQQADFMKSAFMWFLPWVLAAIVGLGALWIAIDAAFGGEAEAPARDPDRPAAVTEASPSETPSPDPTPSEGEDEVSEDEDGQKKEKKKKLITDGVTVQVLNGTSSSEADDRIADKLEGLGFEIVAINDWREISETVVYWSLPNSEEAALQLADKFGWAAEPKPAELSSEVRLHVLVGGDEASP